MRCEKTRCKAAPIKVPIECPEEIFANRFFAEFAELDSRGVRSVRQLDGVLKVARASHSDRYGGRLHA
jgi:hypothetical protein